MEGWIRLHRKFLVWEWFENPDMIKLFIFLLLSANHKDSVWQGVNIKRGQYLTGLNSLNSDTKISFQKLRTCLKRLQKTGEINTQSTNKYSIITICNYDSYQDLEQPTNKQTNKQLTINQQATNNKQEYNNEKKDILVKIYFEKSPEIDSAFKDYLKLRISNKYSITDRAIDALVRKLRELSDGNKKEALQLIENAILGKWKSFYPLKS